MLKTKLHPSNKHRSRYDFDKLIQSYPRLKSFVKKNKYGDISIDFSDQKAVLSLNTALLKHFYKIDFWEIPQGYLCPPIPGRADYIHNIADLIRDENSALDTQIKCLDIGVGANCIYPIIGVVEYGWSFVGTDIDPIAIESANRIVRENEVLNEKVELRLQKNSKKIFDGVIKNDEYFDMVICNPPFHSSYEEANRGNKRKLTNLNKRKITKSSLNFGGKSNELWCEGGEKKFIGNMIDESKQYAKNCKWFTTLVSKKANLPLVYKKLKSVKPKQVKTIEMGQGNKISRIVAWKF